MSSIFDLFKQIEKSRVSVKPEYAVIGLGNPGEKYVRTRHNIGFMVLDFISQKLGIKINKLKYKALITEAEIDGVGVLLVKPQTYMNNSGESVRELCGYTGIDADHIIVVYDDISLPAGKLRVREKGSSGGHNGIKSITAQLGTDVFKRIKIGVGMPDGEEDVADYVLSEVPFADREAVYRCIGDAFECIKLMVSGDTQRAMSIYNRNPEKQ